jgi:hypothetical protein
LKVVLHVRPQAGEKFKREHRQTVWCHSEECAIQALAVARYGPASQVADHIGAVQSHESVSRDRENPVSVLPGIQASEDARPNGLN